MVWSFARCVSKSSFDYLMRVSISLSMSSVVDGFWFILNLLQFLANVFQSICAVWCCRLALFWIVNRRATGR